MRRGARVESQLRLYKIMSVLTVTNGHETWIVRKNHCIRIQSKLQE